MYEEHRRLAAEEKREVRFERELTLGNFFNPSSPSFLGGSVSPIIPQIIGAGIGAFTGYDPALFGAATGAFTGGVSRGGGVSGAVTGGLSGYGVGSLGNAFSSSAFGTDLSGLASTASNSLFGPAMPELLSGGGAPATSGGFFSNLFSGGGSGSSPEMLELLKKLGIAPGGGALSTAVNLGSGLYGLKTSADLKALSQQASGFDPQRAQYASQLSALNANPSSITSMPNFKAGESAVINRMKAQGYLGSGNMADAIAKYGSDFFTSESNRLGQLAGAQFAPGAGGSLAVSSADLASKALASLGYGARSIESLFGNRP